MTAASNHLVELTAGAWRAVIAPAHGGAVRRLTYDSNDIFRRAPEGSFDPLQSACYPCVPWFGRLYEPLDIDGKSRLIAPTHPACDPNHAIHGYGWVRRWIVTAQSESNLTCEFGFEPDEDEFPFSFSAELEFAMKESGLTIGLTLRNRDEKPMPAGLGLHPFFPRNSETQFEFSSEKFWTPPGDSAGKLSDIPKQLQFGEGAPLPAQPADHTFSDFAGCAIIRQDQLQIVLTSAAPHLHFYAPQDERFFCLEPVTHLPGRFGEDILHPNETLALSMSVSAG